ncbi:prephenate dehydratase [Calidifontibacter sp. DB0510]|uniref:Prephenate dehydratase n=1 Tax=Metallococcus carri TaxID=1656884 RepID=A0A967EHW0_9MICO|nr:prephenate dehydratase [Metallococcus carri]NHN57228.1 prephenate dehydratase [Metallococcus carri]NOP37969.1 prephenate dehydratase [Calidifontibacter sp. DB2511S]
MSDDRVEDTSAARPADEGRGAAEGVRYGYFGPRGTFTQMALASHLHSLGMPQLLDSATAFATVPAALDAVAAGEVDEVMVPIENSVEGGVSATLDALNARDGLLIRAEVLVPITFVLAVRAGTTLGDIEAVGSHSHAWPQVRGWMAANAPAAQYIPTLSTAAAAADLGADGEPPYQAAVCAPGAAETFGLTVLASDIGDNANAVTRFVLVSGPGAPPAPTGADKTTIMLYQHSDHAGGLLALLEQFAARDINMTRLESRPTGAAMGQYGFSIDFEGHVSEERVGEALMGLHRVAAQVRFLGSYPRADRRPPVISAQHGDRAFSEARSWLRSLRTGD